MLKIYGRTSSANVMKPLWVADELGIPFEQFDVGGPFGGTDTADYRAMNPGGLVPTIDDDGFVLWESNAITRYLCARYGAGVLWPEDIKVRAIADQWMDWKQTSVMPVITPIFWGLVRTPPADRDMALINRSIKRGGAVFAMLDAQLAKHAHVAGEQFSMGDIPLGPQVHRWLNLVTDRPATPHLDAWYARLAERPAFRRWCMGPMT